MTNSKVYAIIYISNEREVIKMRKHICKNCLYLIATYGWKRDNKGNRKAGTYFCSNPNCTRTLTDFPNKCQYKVEESEKKPPIS